MSKQKGFIGFTCTALRPGKRGILLPDENGYREIPLGALNMHNQSGFYYPYEACRELFEDNSALMRRISTGCLKGEEGHPTRLPGWSDDDYVLRVRRIVEQNVAAHISSVWLDFDNHRDDQGRKIVVVMGKVAPSGVYGPALERSFQNPQEDVCFSIRSLTEDEWRNGVFWRSIREIVTWDRVTEPGIKLARKFSAPALESHEEILPVTRELLQRVARREETEGVAMESGMMSARTLLSAMGWDESDLKKIPAVLQW